MTRKLAKLFFFAFLLVLLVGCGGEADTAMEALPTDLPPKLYAEGSLDIVVLFDTSGSMDDEAKALCDNVDAVMGRVQDKDIPVRYGIWGIAEDTFRVWDEAAGDNVYESFCLSSMVPEQISDSKVQHFEDWGQAIIDVAENYAWQANATRIIIPISDECPVGGSDPLEEPVNGKIVHTCNEADEAIIPAVWGAAKANNVRVFPIAGAQFEEGDEIIEIEPVIAMMETIAGNTGGVVFRSQDAEADIADGLSSLIQFALVDRDGDGVLSDEEIGKKSSGWKWFFIILVIFAVVYYLYTKRDQFKSMLASLSSAGGQQKTSASFGVMLEDGSAFSLKEGDRFGSGDACEVRLSAEDVDEVHAELLYSQGKWMLYDNDSRSGVWQDGEKRPILQVKPGTQVTLGKANLHFFALQGAPVAAKTPEKKPAQVKKPAPSFDLPDFASILAPVWQWLNKNKMTVIAIVIVLLVVFLLFKACGGEKEEAPAEAEIVFIPPTEVKPTEVPTEKPKWETAVSDVDGIPMVFVPASEFIMGTDNGEENEGPAHLVYLDAFWIDQLEVTNAMYAVCVESGICEFTEIPEFLDEVLSKSDHPVVFVNWHDAKTYCEWVGRRLPSEAEWEKAARGTDQRTYPWGEGLDCNLAQYSGCGGQTIPVGSKQDGASPYGVMDMIGNVWEWTADVYDADYYSSQSTWENPINDPTEGQNRVLRGGAWNSSAGSISAIRRIDNISIEHFPDTGFRCATSDIPGMAIPQSEPTVKATVKPADQYYGELRVSFYGDFPEGWIENVVADFSDSGAFDLSYDQVNDFQVLELGVKSGAYDVVVFAEGARAPFEATITLFNTFSSVGKHHIGFVEKKNEALAYFVDTLLEWGYFKK